MRLFSGESFDSFFCFGDSEPAGETEPVALALDYLASLGVDAVYTSGGATDAHAGRETIARLVGSAQGRVLVIPAGGVTVWNAVELQHATGARLMQIEAH